MGPVSEVIGSRVGSGLLRRSLSVSTSEGLSRLMEGLASRGRLAERVVSSGGVVRRFVGAVGGGAVGGGQKQLRLLRVPFSADDVPVFRVAAGGIAGSIAGSTAGGISGSGIGSGVISSGRAYLDDTLAAHAAIEGVVAGPAVKKVVSNELRGVIDSGVQLFRQRPVCRLMPTVGLVQQLHGDSIGHCAFGAGRVRSVFRRLYNFNWGGG